MHVPKYRSAIVVEDNTLKIKMVADSIHDTTNATIVDC